MKLPVIFVGIALCSCLKAKDTNPEARTIQYEVTGLFSGSLIISESQKNGAYYEYHPTSLPWQKDTIFPYREIVSIGAFSQVPGNPGEKVSLKIYSGGKIVNDTTVVADNTGNIVINPVSFSYTIQ